MDSSAFVSIILFTFIVVGIYLVFTNQVDGRAKMILIVAIIVVFIIVMMSLPMFQSYTTLISSPQDATQTYSIPSSTFTGSQASSYSLSTWIYINDWNIKYGVQKIIMQSNDAGNKPQLLLDAYDNNLIIKFNTNGTSSTVPIDAQSINIKNINIQKWVNITVCFGDNTVDTYINGKLVNTFVTTGTQHILSEKKMTGYTITPNGGFSGSISNARYYNTFLTPQNAWDIYNSGFSNNMLAGFLNQFGASFTFYQNGNKTAEFNL